jgi:hypothetical protein
MPDKGWQPDPSWPPAPPGWPLVIDPDEEAKRAEQAAEADAKRAAKEAEVERKAAERASALERKSAERQLAAEQRQAKAAESAQRRAESRAALEGRIAERKSVRREVGIEAAVGRMSLKLGARNEIKHLLEYLEPEETVLEMASGEFTKRSGLLVLTDRRIIFLFHGIVNRRLEEFRLATVSAISSSGSLTQTSINLTVPGATATIHSIPRKDGARMINSIRSALTGTLAPPSHPALPAATPAEATSSQPDVLGQLKQLAELRDAGIVSAEEFEAKKAELLGRL